MVVIREAEIVLNPIDRVSHVLDGIFSRLSRLTGEKIVPIDLDKKIFKNLDTTQDRLNGLAKKKVNVNITENSADVAKNVMGKFDDIQNAFSQPLSLTITDHISRHIDSIGKQLDILRAKAIIPVGLSTGAAAAGLAVGAIGVAAVGMGVAATIPAAAAREAAMVRVNKPIGREGEAAKGVQKDMQDMMMATGMGLDQIAAAYETAGGAGIGGDLMAAGDMEGARKEISDFVRITLEASSAFGMTTDATSSMLSGIANVYKPIGEETNDFLRSVGSGIDAVADATIASEEKILTAMSHASSAMAMFEQTDATVKGTIALSAALISTNMSGDAAGEAIKDFFNYAKTDAENKISKSLGMKASEYQVMLKSDPMAIVEAVTAKYNTMSAEEQGAYSKFFGMTGGKIPQLSGSANFQAGLLKAQGVVNPAYESGTKMSESFGKSLAGTWTQIEKLKQTITVFAQVIGSAFLPGLNAILSAVNAILAPLATFVRYVAELGAKIPGMDLVATAASILAVVTAVSALASFLGPVIAGLGLASKAMMILSMYGHIAGLAISTMAGTIGTIVGILGGPLTIILVLAAAVGYLLYKTGYLQKAWDKFKDSAIGKDLIGGLVTGIAWVTDEFTKLFSWLDEQWAKGSEGAFGWLIGALDTVASTFGWLFDKLDDAYESGVLGKALKISLIGLFPIIALVKSLETLIGFAGKLLGSSNIVADVLSAGRKAWDTISGVLQWLYDTVKGTISWLDETIDGISTDVTDWLSKLWDGIAGLAGSISDTIKGWLQGSVEGIPDTIVEWLKKLWDAITGLPSSISSAINGWLPWGSDESGGSGPLGEQEVVNLVKEMKFDDGSNKFNFSDEVLHSAYNEAVTGVPQEHPNLTDPEKYDKLVAKIADVIRNPSLYQNMGSYDTKWSPHETEVKRSEGKIDYEASKQSGIDAGLILEGSDAPPAEQMIFKNSSQYAAGATFEKGGLFAGLVHSKEEIIPQAIAQKGTGPLSKVLGDIQQSDGGASRRSVNINVEGLKVEVINPVVPDSGAAYQLSDVLRRQLEPFIESVVMRKVAQYIT